MTLEVRMSKNQPTKSTFDKLINQNECAKEKAAILATIYT